MFQGLIVQLLHFKNLFHGSWKTTNNVFKYIIFLRCNFVYLKNKWLKQLCSFRDRRSITVEGKLKEIISPARYFKLLPMTLSFHDLNLCLLCYVPVLKLSHLNSHEHIQPNKGQLEEPLIALVQNCVMRLSFSQFKSIAETL